MRSRPYYSRILLGLLPVLLLLGYASPGSADIFETMVNPGEVIEGHAKFELECEDCHESFRKGAQRHLCLDCHDHRDINNDITQHEGFHGRMQNSAKAECRTCHTDHQGRDADIVQLTPGTFDHDVTDFPLNGAHQAQPCSGCHESDRKYREAPVTCVECHEQTAPHKGRLGDKCDSCHNEDRWLDTDFDHDKTDFPLKHQHTEVDCSSCHPDERYKEIATECVACHRLNDAHGGHYGSDCAECHNEKDWDETQFDHDADTDFKLRGNHKEATCISCHLKPIFDEAPPIKCYGCHKLDDVHKGQYGRHCQDCHSDSNWQESSFDHQDGTDFPLQGKHKQVQCNDCHKGNLEEELDTTCISCHQADDVHQGQQGKNCQRCHDEEGFSGKIRFDHDLTRFPLIGQHSATPCEECHLQQTFKDTALQCSNCHTDDDIHKQGLGPRCEQCHTPNDWNLWQFDHNTQTEFELDGKHEELNCNACHRVPVDKAIEQASDCFSCHRSDDIHYGGFGRFCERCHVTESFSRINIGR